MSDPRPAGESTKAREHLANERTLLAWVRTAIALMGLGFVVARFGLFLREISATAGITAGPESAYSAPIGLLLVASGIVAMVISTLRFFQARRQIDEGAFVAEAYPEIVVVVVTLVAGGALVAYLAVSAR